MEAFTYHLMWCAAATYSQKLAPEGQTIILFHISLSYMSISYAYSIDLPVIGLSANGSPIRPYKAVHQLINMSYFRCNRNILLPTIFLMELISIGSVPRDATRDNQTLHNLSNFVNSLLFRILHSIHTEYQETCQKLIHSSEKSMVFCFQNSI